jgi:hypothetical protein
MAETKSKPAPTVAIRQHKRMAMGMPVQGQVAGASGKKTPC